MRAKIKIVSAALANVILLSSQILAGMPPITFESPDYVPYQSVGLDASGGWQLFAGGATITEPGFGHDGGQALILPADPQQEPWLRKAVDWNPQEKVAFIDFQIKPVADPEGSYASFFANGTQIAFQTAEGASQGDIWVYHGNDGSGPDPANPSQWCKTAASFPLSADGTTSASYLRVTIRHDYDRNLWDLFVSGKLVAANLSYEGRGPNLQTLEFFGSRNGDTLLDDLSADPQNMLFADSDKDGLPDAWEIANGSNPNLHDRDEIKPGTDSTFLDLYMDSLWATGAVNANAPMVPSVGIPPLQILGSHQPVSALKGALSIGGDGSSTYSVPIDIPKGTAGMEPKLSLGYSSNGGNGIVGLGWNLTGLQRITRGPSSMVKDGSYDPADFDDNDRFFLDGERLICVAGTYGMAGSQYRTELDSFARITAVGTGPLSWKVETKAGLVVTLGGTANSRFAVSEGIVAWDVNRVGDTHENYYSVEYVSDPTGGEPMDLVNHRVSSISYTGNSQAMQEPYCHVLFDYESRPDTGRSYSKYYGTKLTKRLAKIRVTSGDFVNHSYVLSYTNSYQSGRSLLTSITKREKDDPALAVPPTVFNYDGLAPGEAIWADQGNDGISVAMGGDSLSSMFTIEDEGNTVHLRGTISREINLASQGIKLHPDSMMQFEFQSDRLDVGAEIGPRLDIDLPDGSWHDDYGHSDPYLFSRIGPNGLLYQISDGWKTFTVPIAVNIPGDVYFPLVFQNWNGKSDDIVSNAKFRNIRIYRSGSQQPADVEPIQLDGVVTIPRMFDKDGKDLGVRFADLNSDGLLDIVDWRVVKYINSGTSFTQSCVGTVLRNTGNSFVVDETMRPPAFLPFSNRPSNSTIQAYNKRHHLLAQTIDIDGDGQVDLIGSVDIKTHQYPSFYPGYLKNQYAFYSLVDGVWTEKSGWRLPFYIDNVPSSNDYGGSGRDDHFMWTDLNADGYPDLVVHTTSKGRLYDRVTNALIIGGDKGIAYINKGINGPGWVRDDSVKLPRRMMNGSADNGRRLADLDGDGIQEITESKHNGSSAVRHTYVMDQTGSYKWNCNPDSGDPPPSPYDLPTGLISNGIDLGVLLIDVNGDGMMDVVRSHKIDSQFVRYTWLNQGSRGPSPWGLESTPQSSSDEENTYTLPVPLHYKVDSYRIPYGFEAADLNGDGLIDILYSDLDSNFTPGPDNLAILNTGNGWRQRPEWGMPGDLRYFDKGEERKEGKRRAKLQDLNGDGFPDLLTGLRGDLPQVWMNQCKPEVLKSVTDGFGSELQIDYHRLNDPSPTPGFNTRVYEKHPGILPAGHAAIIDARLVVSRYSEPDGRGGRRYKSQRYGDLRYDRFNETSLGFGWIEALDELTAQVSRTETSRAYPFAGSPVYSETKVLLTQEDINAMPPSGAAGAGLTPGWKCLTMETASYAEMPSQQGVGGIIRRPVQTSSTKSLFDLDGSLKGETTTTQPLAGFDAYGFVTSSTVTALDGSSVSTSSQYSHSTTNGKWHLGRLSQSTVVKSGGGKPSIAKTSSFLYDNTTGLLKSETVEPGHPLSVTTSYTHDVFGNVTQTSVVASGAVRTASSTYDARGRFVISESNQLGHAVNHHYDFPRAVLNSSTDINGNTTAFTYDGFGTLILTHHPDGTKTGETTGFAGNHSLPASVVAHLTNPIAFFRAKQSSGSPASKVYLDALGRELVTETTILRNTAATDASRYSKVYAVIQYDERNRKVAASDVFAAGETPLFTRIDYDFLNRTIKTTHPDLTFDQILEHGPRMLGGKPVTYSKAANRNGQILERWEDQHGRMIQSMDPSGQINTFQHDHEGRLLSVTVGGQTLLTNTWDLLGNRVSVTEVNSGTSSSTYNGFGEMTSATNARGQTTTTSYDVLGRAISVTKPEGTFTMAYDGAPGAGLGQPWKTTGPDNYQESVSYDGLGRAIATTTTRFGETFTTSTTYDSLGRVAMSTDAGGLTVVNEYDATYSFPLSTHIGPGVEGAGTLLWKARTFDAKGRAVSQTLAQGVVTGVSYNPASGLVEGLVADHQGTLIQSKACFWEPNGNLRSRTDLLAKRSEIFTYDHLNRLTGASVMALPGATITTVPPPAQYSYDTKGNLVSKSGATLQYGGPRPHAVTSATIKGAARSYAYDAAGHVTSDGKRSYTWASFGQLKSLAYLAAPALQDLAGTTVFTTSDVETQFDFDAGGNRARQMKKRINLSGSRAEEETLYLGSYEREIHGTRASASAIKIHTKTVHRHSLGGAIYTRSIDGSGTTVKLTTVIQDHLGSTDLLLTGTWNGSGFSNPTSENQAFDPWGERRKADTWENHRISHTDAYRTTGSDYKRGYTGHEQLDDSGLIHMNGRIYDPELGRFLSPDPVVQIPEYSQDFNRYSYVLNNPLNATDPSGFSWLSKAFSKIGNWLKQNWRTVVSIVVGVALFWTGIAGTIFAGIYSGVTGASIVGMSATAFYAGMGAVTGAIMGGFNAALAGGDLGDVLRGMTVGAIQGAITMGVLNNTPNYLVRVGGHGLVGGATNVAMGGKFQDGFISAAAGHAFPSFQLGNSAFAKAVSSGMIGGTASALGGGKFSNGAFSAAFMRLMSEETINQDIINRDSVQAKWFYPDGDPSLSQSGDGHGINGSHPDAYYQKWADDHQVAVFHIYSEGGFSGSLQDIGEVLVEKLLGGVGSKNVSKFIEGYEKIPAHARLNISTHSQGVSPVVAAMFRRPDLFNGSHLDARSSSVYALRIRVATWYSGSTYTWNMAPGPDIANVYASMNPIRVIHALSNPIKSCNNHSLHSVDNMRYNSN